MKIEHINSSEFNARVLENKKVVLVDFFATWCMPCQMQGKVLEDVVDEVSAYADIIKIDIDENEDVARKFGIMSIPTMIVFVGGKEKEKIVGFRPANELINVLEKYK